MNRPILPTPRLEEIRAEFEEIRNARWDIGDWKSIAGWLSSSPNPFTPSERRRPKPEVLIVVGYLGLMIIVSVVFNRI